MVIQQGDVVWVRFPPPRGSAPAGRRPAIVLQHDRFNRTRLNTVIVAAITSNLRYGGLPGNIRLPKGEGGLPRPSVVTNTIAVQGAAARMIVPAMYWSASAGPMSGKKRWLKKHPADQRHGERLHQPVDE